MSSDEITRVTWQKSTQSSGSDGAAGSGSAGGSSASRGSTGGDDAAKVATLRENGEELDVVLDVAGWFS